MKRDGFVIIDKAMDCTSFDVVKKVRALLRAKKVGHTGTLDPIATGVLPICVGRATKLSSYVMDFKKTYIVTAKFGSATDSHDRTGTVIQEAPFEELTQERVESAMNAFRGDIMQIAPLFSAVKMDGKPLYWYARQGLEVEKRKERACTIYRFEMTKWDLPFVEFQVESSKGTYVRTLVHDLAQKLGSAAHVDTLRRVAVGDLDESKAITLEAFEKLDFADRWQQLISMNEALDAMPGVQVNDSLARRIRSGKPVMLSDLLAYGDAALLQGGELDQECFRLTGPNGELVAVASLHENQNISAKTLPLANRVVQTHRVFL